MRLDIVETRHLSAANAETMVSVTGEVRREVLRTDRYGRRYLRFSVAGEGASIRCYWFLGAGSQLDRLRHGERCRVRGEPRWLGDEQVLVVRSFGELDSPDAQRFLGKRCSDRPALGRRYVSRAMLRWLDRSAPRQSETSTRANSGSE
jgi:RecG-like helicase